MCIAAQYKCKEPTEVAVAFEDLEYQINFSKKWHCILQPSTNALRLPVVQQQ
jgi:hypothetical protein